MSSKKGSPVGILLLVVAGGVLSAIANYWRELLALGLTGLVAWAIYKFIVSGKASPEQAPTVSPPEQPITPASPRPDIAPFVKRQPAPQAVASNNGNDYWVSPGRSVTVNGYTIEGGVYIGKGLSAVASSEVEPALINRDLPINRQTGDCTIRHLDYWPSYERATPTARTAYLEWLSTGRNRLNADIGYVFLFFYGLERRALHDARTSAAAESDVAWIKAEVERLLSIYGGNGSFHSYASSFLDLLNYQRYDSELYKQPPPLVEPGRGLGLGHRIGLGECVKQGAPLPADWAYAWFYADPTTLLRTAARRCPDEFRALFLQRYGEVFGAGLAIAPNKTQLKFERRPASSSFTSGGQKHFLQFDLPDPSVLTAPVKKLQGIADWCYPKLDGYSRFLGKAGANKESFDALLELPLALWPPQYRQVFEKEHNDPPPFLSRSSSPGSRTGKRLTRPSCSRCTGYWGRQALASSPMFGSVVRYPDPSPPSCSSRTTSPPVRQAPVHGTPPLH